MARSGSCVCAEAPGELPVLYFPVAAIDLQGSEGLSDCLRPGALPELTGYAAFDQDRVQIDVTDEAEGDAARDVTVKRFPTWGDATDLVDVMDVLPTDDGLSFVTVARSDDRRPVVEGSRNSRTGHRRRRPACRGPARRLGQHDLPARRRRP